MTTLADYPQVEQLFVELHALTDPAEAHGTLSGALCAAGGYRVEDWMAEVLPEGAEAARRAAELRGIYEHTRRALGSPDMEFELLIPGDELPLATRTLALGHWCNGFLYGLGSNGAADPQRLPGDAGEVVRDLTEITRAGVDDAEDQETNESAYFELVEFVRVGVQLIFEELQSSRQQPPLRAALLH